MNNRPSNHKFPLWPILKQQEKIHHEKIQHDFISTFYHVTTFTIDCAYFFPASILQRASERAFQQSDSSLRFILTQQHLYDRRRVPATPLSLQRRRGGGKQRKVWVGSCAVGYKGHFGFTA